MSSGLDRRTLLGLAAAGGLGAAVGANAQLRPPEPNRDFRVLTTAVRSDVPRGQVEVIEFFWYNCPHCYAFEPALHSWLRGLPAWVSFRRIPVAFRPAYVPQQRLYYALEAMGQVEAFHSRIFTAIHAERVPMGTDEQALAWAAKVGLDAARLRPLLNSFGVISQSVRATQIQDAYQIASVPSFGVGGRFQVDTEQAGDAQRMLRVVEYLAGELRRAA